jgi:hypothetical protein
VSTSSAGTDETTLPTNVSSPTSVTAGVKTRVQLWGEREW